VPLAIQDRMFTTEGEFLYPNEGDNEEHPVWTPEFFGDVILVNGKVWPYLEVQPRKYRFRFLDGSNARFTVWHSPTACSEHPVRHFIRLDPMVVTFRSRSF
jgi:FtsP/CotA-like multicopper oxidase with cupredoxin domain